MFLSPRWKTPGLHTYVSSKPSKIGCKSKYFVDCCSNFFTEGTNKNERLPAQIYKLLQMSLLYNFI